MAGSFKALFKDSFLNQSIITVNHNLNLLQIGVIVNIGGEARNDLVQSVSPNPADPRNSVIINLVSSQTGDIACVDSDYIFVNIPAPENTAVLSQGGVMTDNNYDPTGISSDVFDRSNHTGTQLASTISNFATEVSGNAAVAANTAKVTNANHTGDVAGATTLTIQPNVVENSMLSPMPGATLKGNNGGTLGAPTDLTQAEVRTLLNVEDGADVTDAANVAAAGAVMETLADAKGDIFVATANDSVTRLPLGTDGHVLTADSAEPTGVKWSAGGGGGGVAGPGSSVDKGRVTWSGTGGSVVADVGLRDYGASATDPASPTPSDGDTYWNTTLKMQMYYDGSRSKWLSVKSETILFGRSGNVGGGAYYRTPFGSSYSSTAGRVAEYNGTVISISYTRSDSDAATFEVTANGSGVATLPSSANSGKDTSINADFSSDQILGARNQAGSNTTSNVDGVFIIRWRV